MLRIAVNVVLTAVLFCFIFPKFATGVQFHGEFWPEGVIYAAIFTVIAAAVVWVIRAFIKLTAVATLGAALLLTIPAVLLGFWLVPALQLKIFALYFPEHLHVDSWGSAIWGGFLLMIVNYLSFMLTAPKSQSST